MRGVDTPMHTVGKMGGWGILRNGDLCNGGLVLFIILQWSSSSLWCLSCENTLCHGKKWLQISFYVNAQRTISETNFLLWVYFFKKLKHILLFNHFGLFQNGLVDFLTPKGSQLTTINMLPDCMFLSCHVRVSEWMVECSFTN